MAGDHYSSGGPFINCINLEEVILNDGLESIGKASFEHCLNLKHIVIPATVANIGGYAFSGCSGIKSVVVPQYVLNRGISAVFPSSYSSLEQIDYSSTITNIPQSSFAGCRNLASVAIPSSVSDIGADAFADCARLGDVTIPNSVTNIAVYAFSGCIGLRSVTISDGLTCIDVYAFKGCSSLVSVTIPNTVKRIGVDSFKMCNELLEVRFNGMPPEVKKSWQVGSVKYAISGDGIIGAGVGTYPVEYKQAWKAVIDENGYWHGLKMKLEGAPDSYKVMFDKNGGDSVSVESLTRDDGAAIGALPTAAREGYDFAGWFTDSAGGTEISGATVVTGDVTYYAHWTQRKPETYTIIYNVTDGEGSVASQTCEFGEEVYVDDGGTLHWEGHCFAGWALELDGDVAVKPGETVPPPTDGSKIVNLYAKWRPVMLAPLSADWQKGEITLMYGSMEAGMGMSVECRRGDDPSAIWNDIGKEVELSPVVDGHVTITDRNFSSRYDGIPPVEYRVKDTAGGEATCMTRVKYVLAVGVSNFQNNWLKGHASMANYATKFATLAQEGGAKLVALLRDEDATLVKINESFASLASMVQTGDVCLFYFGTHGGVDPGTTNPGLWLYQKGIYYSEENLANHIDSLAADWGVATVGIVHACHSGGLADNSNDTYCKGGWCVNSMLTSPNAAWITSTDSADVSAVGDHFLEFLIGYGWEKGWAGSEGKALTFGSLADYMGKTYDELFSGVLVEDNPKVIKAGITNKPLLDRIAVGICAHHETKPKPTAFSITPSTDDPDKVSLKTSEVSADKLSVFSRFVRTGRWTLWDPYDGGNQPALYCLNQDTTKKGEAANTRHSSENDKMEFIVKAYTGAGVTAAYNNPVQGWRAAMAAQTEDGRTWNYGKVEGGVSIVSAAESSASGYSDALKGDVAIPSTLEGMSVVSISAHAFEGCEEITSVTIPDSVTSIGDRAFYGCTGLTSVTISDSVTNIGEHAFAECDQLQSLVFPPSVKSIGFGAVSYCESLDRIAFSENLESIGDFAFYGNPALTAVYIPSSVREIGMGAFAYCDSLASIDVADDNAEYASANGMLFTKDKKTLLFVPGGMREMLVPSGVELIGASAAEGCFNLEIASLPASVIEIGEFAFAYCSKLPRFRIPDQVRAIGDGAFLQCGAMEDIALPASLTTLGDGVFAGCTNIVSLTVAESNTNFMVLDDILYGQDLSTLYYALNSVRKVHVPEGVKLIASDAFVFCKELQDVVLPSSLNRIASEAFGDCDALGSIRIPKEVSEIGEYAFYECDNLTNVCFEGNAPSVGDHAFDEIAPTCVVHVRRDSTGWGVDIPGTWNGLRIEYSDGDGPAPTPAPEPTPTPEPTSEPVVVPELYETVDDAVPATASEYNGYLYDEKSGVVAGTIQVKVGKPKAGLAAVKATVVVGAAKASLKAADNGKAAIAANGPTTMRLVGGDPCEVTLGAEGLSGSYGPYQIDGARNFFTSKDKGEQGAANGILEKWIGPVNVVWSGGNASVSIGKKGKAKAIVTLADGTKATANAQLLVGEEWLCVPVVVTKKMNLAFTLWLPRNGGAALVDGLSGDAVVGKPGALAANAAFRVGKSAALWQQIPGTVLTDYLPDGMAVTQSGAKWTLPKTGKVQKAKDGTIDSSKLGDNPSALKLTYKAKDGSFKGSFKVYADNGGKLKATTVNVTGVVINGVGYGTATIKKVGSVPVKVE